MPTRPSRKRASGVFAHAGDVGAGDGDRPAVGFSSPAATISSEDLPEPDGPVSATLSPARHGQRHAGQDVHRPGQAFQGQAYVLKLKGGRGIVHADFG